MSNNAETWDYADDYMSQTLTRETPHGVFRAVVEVDQYAEAPDYECGCPVYRMTFRSWSSNVEATGYGCRSDDDSGVDIERAFDYFEHDTKAVPGRNDTITLLDRWLRIFHGGSCKVISSTVHQGGDSYLTYDTRAMRESWGQTGDMLETSAPEADEWQAYIDGEVYGIRVERATFVHHYPHARYVTSGVTCLNCGEVDPDMTEMCSKIEWSECEGSDCWGYYSEEWAKQAAIEALDAEINYVAEGMLPLEGESA